MSKLTTAKLELSAALLDPKVQGHERTQLRAALQIASQPTAPRKTSPAELKGLSPEGCLLAVVGDASNSEADRLRATRALGRYYAAIETPIPDHLQAQLDGLQMRHGTTPAVTSAQAGASSVRAVSGADRAAFMQRRFGA